MNYLAHLLLSGDNPQMMIGGLLGDFVKGPLIGKLPDDIEQGIRLHRALDVFVDQQAEMHSAIKRIEPNFRRYGGIIIDISFDHILARQWHNFHHKPLPQYASEFYAQLNKHYQLLPPSAQRFADNAPRVRLLESYAQPAAIAITLQRVAKRLSKPVALELVAPHILKDLELLSTEFDSLFPRLKTFSEQYSAPVSR